MNSQKNPIKENKISAFSSLISININLLINYTQDQILIITLIDVSITPGIIPNDNEWPHQKVCETTPRAWQPATNIVNNSHEQKLKMPIRVRETVQVSK